jgi:hypothetical protein
MIKLELSIDECNMILRVLGKHPFEEVVAVINRIKEQGEPQVEAIVKAEQEAAAKSAELPAAPAA